MNTIGKILVVFVTASSLGFLAFVIALRNGGPNWKGELKAADLQKEFAVSIEPGEVITYSAKHLYSDQQVEKSPNPAYVVLKARQKMEEFANKKSQELSPQVAPLQQFLEVQNKQIVEDDAGVQVRFQKLDQIVQSLIAKLKDVGNEFSTTTIQAQEVFRLAAERREEAYRLANQLELIRNDKFAVVEQKKVLQDELVRLEENRRRLQRRQTQLKQQLGDTYDLPNEN